MDVYNAYVNADVEEPIYMQQPPRYIEQSDQHVLKPKKARECFGWATFPITDNNFLLVNVCEIGRITFVHWH